MSDVALIQKQIKRGVFRALRFAGHTANADEINEFCQEAWLRYLATQETDIVHCAKLATANYIRRWSTIADNERYIHGEPAINDYAKAPMPETMKDDLRSVFLELRSKRNERGKAIANTEVDILDLLWQGNDNQRIADALGMPVNTIKVYRHRIKALLRRISNEASKHLR